MMAVMLLVGGMTSEVWGATVTYHILTLPIPDPAVEGNYDYHMRSAVYGYRLEAFKITVYDQTAVQLPDHYKSPLATGFTYYESKYITGHGSKTTTQLYQDVNTAKAILYQVKGEDTPGDTSDDATPVAEGAAITATKADYYVVYTYNASNTIAKLDGSVSYNIGVKGKGFLSLNRGRNNRGAVIPTAKVNPEMLASEDFSYVDNPGHSIGTYWNDANNKNTRSLVESKFFFGFKFEGKDPYHIILRTTYNKDTTYIEKNEGTDPAVFVYKWYKGAALMAKSGNNAYISSDDHVQYTTLWPEGHKEPNPTDPESITKTGYFHGNGNIWSTVALLNNTSPSKDGYVFMGTRNGNAHYLLPDYNTLTFGSKTADEATKDYTVNIYPLKKVTFKIATPFYKISATADHIVSAPTEWVSQHTVDSDLIETKYLPAALYRKYCNFNGKFYSDAACTNEITKFSQAIEDPTEGYKVYVGYDVIPDAPKFITPAASYDSTTWAKATWYELTDDGSTQEHGKKIKYNAATSNYKNNGANGEFIKESEFAFVGDPYELKVINRKLTADASGAATYVTLSTHNTWDMPNDETIGSFLLRKYNDTGYWSWTTGHTSTDVSYGSNSTPSVDKNAQTIIINLSGLNGEKYYKVSTGGTGASQIKSVTPEVDNVLAEPGTTATIVVMLDANTSGVAKEMSVTIQEYNDREGNTPSDGSPSVITITQGTSTSAFAGSEVTYSTVSSTRVKVLTLPERSFTYNIVDKSGRIAVKATAEQTIYSPVSLPDIIISPYLYGETVKFFSDNYVDGAGRSTLSTRIYEVSNVDGNIFVTYTTSAINTKPYKISEDQQFNVVLNGYYLWYDASSNSVKTNNTPTSDNLKNDAYLWKLRNRDPYAMLIDNLAARADLSVAGQTEHVDVYNDEGVLVKDDGTPATLDPDTRPMRQKGAWVDLASIANEGELSFTTTRADAQRFVAKANSNLTGVYEVMVATGASVDASTTYYNIGCPAEHSTKIYDNAHYAHGRDELKFRLEQSIPYTYHLIDKSKHELLEIANQSAELTISEEYQSPLVSTYHYYDQDNITISDGIYTVKSPATELTHLSDLDADFTAPTSSTEGAYNAADANHKHTDATTVDDISEKAKKLTTDGNHYYKIGNDYYVVNVSKVWYNQIYVTYDVNDIVTFNTGSYMLRFLDPYTDGYYLEDGNDKLTTGKIQAIYPYCNGDGNLNIYGEAMQDEQFNGGATTRPRWIWYFDSYYNDPYHVRIRSRSTINYNSVSYSTYLTTYAVHFNQDTGEDADKLRVVTGGTLPGVASVPPTEYMVLGTRNNYKLMTTDAINDGETTERRRVTSLEQYWKTYNMAKLHVLGLSKSTNEFSNDPATWVVPTVNDPETGDVDESTFRTTLTDRGWHSYYAFANATRWNGYNDKSGSAGLEKKVVEKLEHWFQTYDMGNGTFDIEVADVPPVLVLLDLHGWEIVRLPLPTTNYPLGDGELAALRAYDSPWVKEYKFYSNATKASGCHKYTLRMQDGKERDQIKVNGAHYTSSSLGDLPPRDATGVISSGAFNDQFVTYTVKEEYTKCYKYSFKDNGDGTYSESGTPSQFLILMNSRFFRDNEKADNPSYISKPIYEASNPVGGNIYDVILDPCQETVNQHSTSVDDNKDGIIDNINLWYVQPNLNIDKEMGIKWGTSDDITSAEPLSEYGTKKKYKDITGFDPYNVQLKNVENNKFITTHQTSAQLNNGILIGDYSGSGGTTNITLESEFSYAGVDPMDPTGSEGYDHTNLKISNQTFMAVSDANGNMQFMPRFDNTKRINLANNSDKSHATLQAPVNRGSKASADDNKSMGPQTIFFVRAQVFQYHIINNSGKEALRYKRSGEYYPAITDHFKSPLAKDFTYYTSLAKSEPAVASSKEEWDAAGKEYKRTLTNTSLLTDTLLLPDTGTYYYKIGTRGVFTYQKVKVTEGLKQTQITGSFAESGLNGGSCVVKVRYSYDAHADHDGDRLLEGKWVTAKLANKDLQASGEVMTFTSTVADNTAYGDAVAALSVDGVYYYRIGPPYTTYKKVTVSSSGTVKTEDPSTEADWTNALGLGVTLYAAETGSRSLTATSESNLDAQADKLTATGDYYFKVGEDYYKVTVNTAYDGETDANHTDDKDDGSKGYDTKWSNSKPLVIDEDDKIWQWKFLHAPADSTSDYYMEPDPYDIQIFNRHSNYTTNPSIEPSPMAVGIKVPNTNGGADHFALLSHTSGGYALAVAGTEAYTYKFLNGATMSTSVAADTVKEAGFTQKNGEFDGVGSQLLVNNDIKHNFTYRVISNGNKLAVSATQTDEEAEIHEFDLYLPESAQTPLLNMKDYKYYGFATEPTTGMYQVIPQTILKSLYGLYDDVVWVRYGAYDMDKTSFKVPNMKTTVDSHVARDESSVDVAMNIDGGLPYNIFWYNDTIMQSTDNDKITKGGSHGLSGNPEYVWYFTGNDPYALKIKHKGGKCVAGTDENLVGEASAPTFMLLHKDGYDYGILQKTCTTDRLTEYGQTTTTGNPNHYIIFGLSIHKLIYHLIIAKSCPDKSSPKAGESDTIPYRTAVSETLGDTVIFGTTQRDLTSVNDGVGPHYAGEKYQLGSTLSWGYPSVAHTYSYDAGSVSLGDTLILPNIFYRTNCLFEFFIEGIYHNNATGNSYTELDDKYKGLKLGKLMSDELLIDQDVVVNVVYKFDPGLPTNAGDGFVTKMNPAGSHDLWYTFETTESTPRLAHYTYVEGMRAEEGRALHYTNDYLWSPLGDPYGFRSYNRYIYKNSGDPTQVLTTATLTNNERVVMDSVKNNGNRDIYELLPSANQITGRFRIHPLLNMDNTLYLDIDNDGKMILSEDLPAKEWTYGLSVDLLNPYYQGAGNIGGLTAEAKANYEEALTDPDAFRMIRRLQRICYNKDSVIAYKPGYYRLFSQPGASSLSPVRYASGYLHKTELTGDGVLTTGAIPMHFYSKAGVNGSFSGDRNPLKTGFTASAATRGDIPIPSTETDPSTIFYFSGEATDTKIQTQGRYVMGDEAKADSGYVRMTTDEASATSFKVADIGGGVVIIYNEAESKRHYINYGQHDAAHIYDLQYYEKVDVDGSKWCMQPADTMGLKISTHNGGDGYYYATFCAPFDVALPNDNGGKTYNAYTCSQWYNTGVHPVAVPATNTYTEGKFVPAGTPVIIRVKDESGSLALSLPTSSPSSALSCVFSGQYLEQLLAVDATHDVYTLGLPMTSAVSKDGDYDETGDITAPLPEFATYGVGFYINASRNKENDPLEGMWLRNNRYVEHNKIYYREGSSGAHAPENKNKVEYVPVIFGDGEEVPKEEQQPDENQTQQRVGDGCAYDIVGRKVASEAAVKNGTWYQGLTPGIYIVDGQKIYVGY